MRFGMSCNAMQWQTVANGCTMSSKQVIFLFIGLYAKQAYTLQEYFTGKVSLKIRQIFEHYSM